MSYIIYNMAEWYKKCYYCGEQIKEWAIKCRYCWEFLNKKQIKDGIEYEHKCECWWIVQEWDKIYSHCGAELVWDNDYKKNEFIRKYSNKNYFSNKNLENSNWKSKINEEKVTFWQRLLYFVPNVILLRLSFSLCYAFIWVIHDLISSGNWIKNTPIYSDGFSFLFGVSVVIWILGVLCTTKKKLYSWTVKASIRCFILSLGLYCIRMDAFEKDQKEQQRILREQECKAQWYNSCYEKILRTRQLQQQLQVR